MELYTYHSLDFNIITDKVNLNNSPHYGDPDPMFSDGFRRAYDFLFEKAGRKDNIWCYGAPVMWASRYTKNLEPERLWILDVPDKHIIAIDSSIWDFALNNWYYLGDHVYGGLLEHVGDNREKEIRFDEQFDKMIADLFDGNPLNSYKNLIKPLKKVDMFHDQFLIPSPIKRRWVIRTYVIQAEAKIGGKKICK